jgi:hypothetical protein
VTGAEPAPAAGSAPGWDEFTGRLARTLAELDERTYVVISAVGTNVFVQYHQAPDALYAEAVADAYLPEHQQLGFEQVDAMKSLGWTPPDIGPGMLNWNQQLPWPARTADYRRLAEASVAALRDIYRVPGPDQLVYRAWQEAERPPAGVTYHLEDLAPYVPHVDLPGLGIPAASAQD